MSDIRSPLDESAGRSNIQADQHPSSSVGLSIPKARPKRDIAVEEEQEENLNEEEVEEKDSIHWTQKYHRNLRLKRGNDGSPGDVVVGEEQEGVARIVKKDEGLSSMEATRKEGTQHETLCVEGRASGAGR